MSSSTCRRLALLAALPPLVLGAAPAHAGTLLVPPDLAFQGLLLDETGAPLEGAVAVGIGIYEGAEGGEPLYEEVHQVDLRGGLLSILIGTGMSPEGSAFDPELLVGMNRWLAVDVDGERLAPRMPFSSVAYALLSERAATADSVPPDAIGPEQLAPGSVYAGALQLGVISTVNLMPNAVDARALARGAVYGGAIQHAAITPTHLARGSVYPGALQMSQIYTITLPPAAITRRELAPGSVYPGALRSDEPYSMTLAPRSVTAQQLAPGSVYPGAIGPGVFTIPLAGDSVTAQQLAPGAVERAALADGAVGSKALATGVVTAANVKPGGGIYASRADLYVNEETANARGPGLTTLRAWCEDDDDLPLQGFCSVVDGEGFVVGSRPSDWSSDSTAGFECSIQVTGALLNTVSASIACIQVD
ncbi:MAG: hypothetical protein QNK03_12925 [Myxococcota bacterium]|nr:hypothetical protein [Myxococcota bacterium]